MNRRDFLKVMAVGAVGAAAPVSLLFADNDQVKLEKGETLIRFVTSEGALHFKLPYMMEGGKLSFGGLSFEAEKTMTILKVEVKHPTWGEYINIEMPNALVAVCADTVEMTSLKLGLSGG